MIPVSDEAPQPLQFYHVSVDPVQRVFGRLGARHTSGAGSYPVMVIPSWIAWSARASEVPVTPRPTMVILAMLVSTPS